ncbi:MAG: glycosyltransferase [Anaerolineae bacterium]|nr:glycosyltransferase [Anaerolineae bacterium]
MKHVVVIVPVLTGSSQINVVRPLRELEEQGAISLTVTTEGLVNPQTVVSADVLVACRNMELNSRAIFGFAQSLGIPWLYDLDDNLWEVPAGQAHSAYHNHPVRQEMLEWMLRNAQRVRVHSPRLREIVAPFNSSITLARAAVDWSLVPDTLPELSPGLVHIVYPTSRSAGDPLFDQMRSDLVELVNLPDMPLRLHIMGADPGDLKRHPKVVFRRFDDNYSLWFSEFTRFGYAIGLAPILRDAHHDSKTDTKFRDYAAAGAAGIYQDSPVYWPSVKDGETGLLVSGEPGSWVAAIRRLIDNPALIETIRHNAVTLARSRNSIEQAQESWLSDISAAPFRPPVPDDLTLPRWSFTVKPDHWSQRIKPLARRYVPARLRIALRNLDLNFRIWLRRAP